MLNRNLCLALLFGVFVAFGCAIKMENIQINQRIVNGTSVDGGKASFYVRIISDRRRLCGGGLITPSRVLTAAHCLRDGNEFILIFGFIRNRYTTGVKYGVAARSDVILHPQYNRKTFANDIGILKIPSPVRLGRNIGLVRIDRTYVNENTRLIVIGSGLNGNREQTNTLQWANQISISNSNCAKAYNRSVILPTVVCTRGPNKIESTCNGDSGGPLIRRFNAKPQLVGVLSFGGGKSLGCTNNIPTGFSRISSYLDFIDKNIK